GFLELPFTRHFNRIQRPTKITKKIIHSKLKIASEPYSPINTLVSTPIIHYISVTEIQIISNSRPQ
ncbi:hypothetical protein AE929_13850, partial [Xanthomonas arboricola]